MAIFQPELSTVYPINVSGVSGTLTVNMTVQEILNKLSAQNLGDSFIIKPASINATDRGFEVFPFYKTETSNIYFAYGNNYLGLSTTDPIGVDSDTLGSYGTGAKSFMRLNSSYNFVASGSFYFTDATVNNIVYKCVSCPSNLASVWNPYAGAYVSSNSPYWINGEKQVTYTWSPVQSITGKWGTFALSRVKQTSVNNGEEVTNGTMSDIEVLSPSVLLQSVLAAVPIDTQVDIMYAGQVDKLAVEVDIQIYKLKFYMAGSSTPFYQASAAKAYAQWIQILIDEENEVAKLSMLTAETTNPYSFRYNYNTMDETEMHQLWLWVHSHMNGDEDDQGDTNEGTEEDPDWIPRPDIAIPETTLPTLHATDTGFCTSYLVNKTFIKELSNYMWSSNFTDSVGKLFTDPKDVIIGVMIMPVTPTDVTSKSSIKIGETTFTPQESGSTCSKLNSQFKDFTIGEIQVNHTTFKFLDYAPYTKCKVYLPYCGEHALDINDIMGSTLKLKYIFDFLTGAVVAEIYVRHDDPDTHKNTGSFSLHYSFTGQTGLQIPTSAEDFAKVYSAVISAGATIGAVTGTIATGGLTAPLVAGTAANMIANGMSAAPEYSYNSGGGSMTGYISSQIPYLYFEEAVPLRAKGQGKYIGKASYVEATLSDISGYTKCMETHLHGSAFNSATQRELRDIETALKSGVYLESGSSAPAHTPQTSGNMVITLLQMKSERNVIGKSWTSTTSSIEGKLIYNQSIESPRILINGDARGYNYCYFYEFGRYYYIEDIILQAGNLQEIVLSVDPLQSFESAIKGTKALIERQERLYSPYMQDAQYWTKQYKHIVTQPFCKDGYTSIFNRGNAVYILTLAGGE